MPDDDTAPNPTPNGVEIERYRVCVDMVWRRVAKVKLSKSGKQFKIIGDITNGPGVYRIRVNKNGKQVYVYTGQATDTRGRVQEQLREHAEIRAILEGDGDVNVQVDVLDPVTYVSEHPQDGTINTTIAADLGEDGRLMMEGIAVVVESFNDGILNRAPHRR